VSESDPAITEKDLRHWRLLEDFRSALERSTSQGQLHRSFHDPERKLRYDDSLSLFLFGLFNPAIKTMRGLCSASRLQRVQSEICGGPVSLGSFSEAQHLVDPSHLEKVFGELAAQVPGPASRDPRVRWEQWLARDSSLFAALPRMTWALYGGGHAGCPNRSVRLHLDLQLLQDNPASAQVTPGKHCERKVWKENWKSGAGYVGDRYFGKNFQLFGQLQNKGCSYVIRVMEEATINIIELIPLTAADRQAGVVKQAWATLGVKEYRSVRLRVVWIEGKDTALLLATNLSAEELPAELVGMLYRRRWQIECFFRWIKCLLQCRHWLAESENGVTIELYLALIASVLLQLHLGRRPNKRMLELLQLYQLGWATAEELVAGLQREQERESRRKTNRG
jgi:DDE family transposase